MPFFDPIRIGAAGAADTAFSVDRSLRFNSSDSAYLERTPSSGGNRKKNTLSMWVKLCKSGLSDNGTVASCNSSNSDSNNISVVIRTGSVRIVGYYNNFRITNRILRDPSAWYHIVVAIDTAQSSADNRIKLYVNGIQETSFSTSGSVSQNDDLGFAQASTTRIGARSNDGVGSYFDGYIAEVNFIDGQALTPSSFAETNSDTGQWVPIDTSGLTFGTTGFYLKFTDNSGTTATTLGKDSSGNSNNFTPNNFSVSSGLGNDSFEDTPTNNFPTLNPLHAFLNGSSSTAENGNLQWNGQSNNQAGCPATMAFPKTGKWYWEVKLLSSNSNFSFGITPDTYSNVINPANPTGSIGYAAYGSKIVSGSETTSWAASFSNSDNIGAALDMDNNEIKFYKNNSLVGTISLVSGYENVNYLAWIKGDTATQLIQGAINFGGNGFVYTPPTGFKALNSSNLDDPTILLPNEHFDTVIYTGSGSGNQSITSLNFQPDWVWIKARSVASYHVIADSLRGVGKLLSSNDKSAEGDDSTSLTAFSAFLTNGFTVGYNPAWYTNGTPSGSATQVAWNWNAGNTDGVTYRVVVVDDSGNKFRFRNSANTATFAQSAVTLDLAEGGTYIFDGSDSTMASHPIVLAENSNGSPMYETGVTYELDGSAVANAAAYASGYSSATTRRLLFTVPSSAPTLYYVCYNHAGMGGAINTNTTLGSSNFDGSTQSTVKANTTAGFSIVKYTGQQNATDTIGHGLGVQPQVVITKSRNSTYTYTQWYVYHHLLTTNYFLFLNLTNAQSDGLGDYFVDSSFSSTVFAVGDDIYGPNVSSNNYIAYCFSEVEGYSKFGSYTGNGSTDGTFVYTGFRPSFILWKPATQAATDWVILDNKRDTFNVADAYLLANEVAAEGDLDLMDFLSNGFKLRQVAGNNESGQTIIYLAFAESPFKNARAR